MTTTPDIGHLQPLPLSSVTHIFIGKIYEITDTIFTELHLGHDPKDGDIKAKAETFKKNVFCVLIWYKRISWVNKKRVLYLFLCQIRSLWALSLILKCIWKCKPKDAILSSNEIKPWTGFDQIPLDHNRSAAPQSAINAVREELRKWFILLSPENQASLMIELLYVSDGPLMGKVYTKALDIYDINRLISIDLVYRYPITLDISDKTQTSAHLTEWLTTTKAMRTNMRIDEMWMIKNDEKYKVWRFSKPRPDLIETVDYIQQLPSNVAKVILSKVPNAQLPLCARVNRYWSYIVDELIAEINARHKINAELDRMKAHIAKYNPTSAVPLVPDNSKVISTSDTMVVKKAHSVPSVKPIRLKNKNLYRPIKKYSDMIEKINQRGAADEAFLRYRCTEMMGKKQIKRVKHIEREHDGLLSPERLRIICPFLQNLEEEQLAEKKAKQERIEERKKRPHLWTLNLLRLQPIIKI